MTDSEEFTGTVKRIVFQNQENGYSVLRSSDGRTLCGNLVDPGVNLEGADFSAAGIWKKHKNYGLQFHFTEFTVNESDLFYYLTRIVRGIGKNLARRLLEIYDDEQLIEVLDNRPEELTKVKGIKSKKLSRIQSSWGEFRKLRELGELLIPHGATQMQLIRIQQHFRDGEGISKKIAENPFIMTEVRGIGFRTADSLARGMGIPFFSLFRIRACIDFVFREMTEREGNSAVGEKALFSEVSTQLATDEKEVSLPFELFTEALSGQVDNGKMVRLGDEKLTNSFLYRAEKTILETSRTRSRFRDAQITDRMEVFIRSQEEEMGIRLSESQKAAIRIINDGAVFFLLCGYAGTGKSTVSRAILKLLSLRYSRDEIMCCALSGIASDRIRKVSGFDSATIQSLLVKAGARLPYQVLLVDESSMVNSEILFRLISKCRDDCRLILVGDPAQLPPIGPGDPFHDLIRDKAVPIVELDKVYRQQEDRMLALYANVIRKGKVPDGFRRAVADFQYIDISIDNYFHRSHEMNQKDKKKLRDANSTKIQEQILSLCRKLKPRLDELFRKRLLTEYITAFQLITPVKNGVLGTETLNPLLQAVFNPPDEERTRAVLGWTTLALYDRVVHIANQDMDVYLPAEFRNKGRHAKNEKRRIFNGMLGIVFKIQSNSELLWVYYPTDRIVVEYTFDEARDLLQLSYALTIHKTQGSEFQTVVIPMSYSHFIMLNNKLLYTAVTRAKAKCILVGESYAFTRACRQRDEIERDTVIRSLITD